MERGGVSEPDLSRARGVGGILGAPGAYYPYPYPPPPPYGWDAPERPY